MKKQNYTLGQTCVIIIEASVTVSNYPSAKLDHWKIRDDKF